MPMKMKELLNKTGTTKATILFYIKEGLLPEPYKPKPNLHLYDEQCVDIINFIKYLQKHFGCSVEEIKSLIQKEHFDINNGFGTLLDTLDVIMGAGHTTTWSEEQLCEHFDLAPEALESYMTKGLLFKRDGRFTQREFEILEILEQGRRQGVDHLILESYVAHARALAQIEVELGSRLLNESDDKNGALKALFDTILVLKPYLFNMHSLKTYQSHKESL